MKLDIYDNGYSRGKEVFIARPEKLTGEAFAILREMPGFAKPTPNKSFIFRPSFANISHILSEWEGDIEWHDEASNKLDAYNDHKATMERLRSKLTSMDSIEYEYYREPKEHQITGINLTAEEPVFALLTEQGTGKTKMVCDTARYLFQKSEIDNLVIISWPNGVHRNWIHEVSNDIPEEEYEMMYWSPSLPKKDKNEFAEFCDHEDHKKLLVYSFSVESIASKKTKELLKKCVTRRTLLVIDQSASIKNPNAKRTEFIMKSLSEIPKYKRILDGAPVAEGPSELFSQFNFLDPNIIGHSTWTSFKSEFCKIGKFNNVYGYKNLERLKERIQPFVYRVLASDCLDLPDRSYKRWTFDLNAKELRIFNEIKKKGLAYFDKEDEPEIKSLIDLDEIKDEIRMSGGLMSAMADEESDEVMKVELALTKNMRLQQISSGWFKSNAGEVRNINEDEKPSRYNALIELLAATEGKSLIFARFKDDIELIVEGLGEEAVAYYGAVKEDDREEAKRKFMTDPNTRYFVGNPRAAGIGHTLTAASNVIFYSNDHSLRLREECEKRAHRMGIEKTLADGRNLLIWDLIASRTQDIKILHAFLRKRKISQAILSDPEDFFLVEDE